MKRAIMTGLVAALAAGPAGGQVPGPFALTNVSQALMRAYNDDDVAALHGMLAPDLAARYPLDALAGVLTRCRVLTRDIFRLSTPTGGGRTYGFLAVYAETGLFEMGLEIDPDERIRHWVITDDATAPDQPCRVGGP
jgi:hypothetical protein